METFPPLHIINPKPSHPHTHTIILLHGRGSNGPEFAEELLTSTSHSLHLASRLPSWRWVFPTSKTRWSTAFEEEFPAWFDIYSLANTSEKAEETQVEGLRESMRYVAGVVEREAEVLGGRVVLGGMSQGMAAGLWSLVCMGMEGRSAKVRGFVGFCGWMPFGGEGGLEVLKCARRVMQGEAGDGDGDEDEDEDEDGGGGIGLLESTRVLLLHGTDDAFVDVELGRQARRVLEQMGAPVEMKEYTGAENEGHWVKEPEGFEAIVGFLEDESS